MNAAELVEGLGRRLCAGMDVVQHQRGLKRQPVIDRGLQRASEQSDTIGE